jgi:hypothetical protein
MPCAAPVSASPLPRTALASPRLATLPCHLPEPLSAAAYRHRSPTGVVGLWPAVHFSLPLYRTSPPYKARPKLLSLPFPLFFSTSVKPSRRAIRQKNSRRPVLPISIPARQGLLTAPTCPSNHPSQTCSSPWTESKEAMPPPPRRNPSRLTVDNPLPPRLWPN